jgi:hypothetical protein
MDPAKPHARTSGSPGFALAFTHIDWSTLHESRRLTLTKTTSTIQLMWAAIATATMFGVFVLGGCSRDAEHADVKDALNSAMTSSNLGL